MELATELVFDRVALDRVKKQRLLAAWQTGAKEERDRSAVRLRDRRRDILGPAADDPNSRPTHLYLSHETGPRVARGPRNLPLAADLITTLVATPFTGTYFGVRASCRNGLAAS